MASEELRELLRSIRRVYEQYAEKLHTAGYWGVVELAAARPETLCEVAEVPIPQASAIVAAAQAKSIGEHCQFLRVGHFAKMVLQAVGRISACQLGCQRI